MKNELINDIIEKEKQQLADAKEEIERLEKKWFKTSATLKYIEFMKEYILKKEKFISSLLSSSSSSL